MTVYSNAKIDTDYNHQENLSVIETKEARYKIFQFKFDRYMNNNIINQRIEVSRKQLNMFKSKPGEDITKLGFVPFDPIEEGKFVYCIGSKTNSAIGSVKIFDVPKNSQFKSMHIFLSHLNNVKFLEIHTKSAPCTIYLIRTNIERISAPFHPKNQIDTSNSLVKLVYVDKHQNNIPAGLHDFHISSSTLGFKSAPMTPHVNDFIKIVTAN